MPLNSCSVFTIDKSSSSVLLYLFELNSVFFLKKAIGLLSFSVIIALSCLLTHQCISQTL